MDPTLVAALVAGLLGGGVTGAIIGGLVALWSQNRAFDHENANRFVDLRRERYAALLRGSNEWVRLLNNQRGNAFAQDRQGTAVIGKPELPETTELWHLAEEVRLLRKTVGDLAVEMVAAVVALGPFSVDTSKPERLHDGATAYGQAMETFNRARTAFTDAAARDLDGA